MLKILRRPHSQDYEAMIYDASVHGLKMIVKDYRSSPAHFPERFFSSSKTCREIGRRKSPEFKSGEREQRGASRLLLLQTMSTLWKWQPTISSIFCLT